MRTLRTSVAYLQQTSDAGLESFQLARLDRTANLRKELTQVVNEMVDSEVEARLARWLLDRRRLRGDDVVTGDASCCETLLPELLLSGDRQSNLEARLAEPASCEKIASPHPPAESIVDIASEQMPPAAPSACDPFAMNPTCCRQLDLFAPVALVGSQTRPTALPAGNDSLLLLREAANKADNTKKNLSHPADSLLMRVQHLSCLLQATVYARCHASWETNVVAFPGSCEPRIVAVPQEKKRPILMVGQKRCSEPIVTSQMAHDSVHRAPLRSGNRVAVR